MQDKVVFIDENGTKALTGILIEPLSGDFISIQQLDRVVSIAKSRVIKIEQSRADENGHS
jgi:hypothetical protein